LAANPIIAGVVPLAAAAAAVVSVIFAFPSTSPCFHRPPPASILPCNNAIKPTLSSCNFKRLFDADSNPIAAALSATTDKI